MINNKQIRSTLLFILGSLLITIIIYFRIIYRRLPKILDFLVLESDTYFINYQVITISIISIIFSSVMIYISLKIILKWSFKIKRNFIIQVYLKIIPLIEEAFFTVYLFFIRKKENSFDRLGI